jgi:hypothetical protein
MNIVEVLETHKLGWMQEFLRHPWPFKYNMSGIESRMPAFRKALRPIEANPDLMVSYLLIPVTEKEMQFHSHVV